MIFTTSSFSLKGVLAHSFIHTENPLWTRHDLQLSIIVKLFCVQVFVRAKINTDATTIYFCLQQSKHKRQTFDGSSLHGFSIDGDIRAHFPPFRGSNSLPFIPVLYEKQLPRCKTIHHNNYQACICSVLPLSPCAELSIFISLCTLHQSLFTVNHLT